MPRPKKAGAPEPKRRSRTGCWPCKARKVKCGEEKPKCLNCERQGEPCDYSIRLNWGGRTKRKDTDDGAPLSSGSGTISPHSSTFAIADFSGRVPGPPPAAFEELSKQFQTEPKSAASARFYSHASAPASDAAPVDPKLGNEPPQADTRGWEPLSFSEKWPQTSTNNPMLQILQRRAGQEYPPSSAPPNLEGPMSAGGNGYAQNSFPKSPPVQSMLPPGRSRVNQDSPPYVSGNTPEPIRSPREANKRLRLSPTADPPSSLPSGNLPANEPSFERAAPFEKANGSMGSVAPGQSPGQTTISSYSPFMATPLTPGSSVASDENVFRAGPRSTPASFQGSSDRRRLSVNSLLSAPPVSEASTGYSGAPSTERSYPVAETDDGYTRYGFDCGQPDLDTPKNDDAHAIRPIFSSPVAFANLPFEGDPHYHSEAGAAEFGFGLRPKDIAFERGGYYAKPVPIKIPKSLEPLPPQLHQNPMNLLYFHHFLNHTARILVPHDCEQNPFRTVLPEMAVRDENLLNLLLAFSASHRARLLNHKEPANRIALLVQNVFPALRRALEKDAQVTDANLTTAIMLCSLEIISPNTFEVPIPWQKHLTTARRMIIARGGLESVRPKDKVSYFLSRWFAYLDVLGSLSGSKNDAPMSSSYWAASAAPGGGGGSTDVSSGGDPGSSETDEIDCFLGFTSRCIGILSRIAHLAKRCEAERLDAAGEVRPGWAPSAEVVAAADGLRDELATARRQVVKGCSHGRGAGAGARSESEAGWDSLEVYATNEAFHWAGLIHLGRRVLGKPETDPEVQGAVREIVGALYKVRRGSSAEACLLFPMFAAGCNAVEAGQRGRIMERLQSVEGFGMTHVHRARTLMQKVWDTGKPWETLVTGEFFG
ncbi:fungal-specific transcription factor domain-containing protein [Lineolata rhizophorae]|uniref:Fungal-specific transcription factor domain-containing protein n=1 Tax=Lineolata rhizophorae TaxID=578093 RepID=A0A6A6NY13_9PEZI|nr:fungal-specific transcription factor domain-containing protein [Lineolata rhizophorae]